MAKHLVQHNLSSNENHALPFIKEGMSKRQVAELADNSVAHVMEEGNVFEVAEALAAMEEFVKTVRKDERYIQFLRDELAKHNGNLVTHSGAKIELCEAGVQYDYSGDSNWRMLDEEMKELSVRKKLIEEKLRSIAPGKINVDHDTGEIIEGAKKTSKSTYRITLKR